MELQRTLDAERVSRQEEIQRLKSEQQEVMEAEDKKYQRRLVSLQERLTAKDKEYTEIIERHQSQEQYSGEDKEVLIESLQVELAKEKEKNSKLQESDDEQGSGNQVRFVYFSFIHTNALLFIGVIQRTQRKTRSIRIPNKGATTKHRSIEK